MDGIIEENRRHFRNIAIQREREYAEQLERNERAKNREKEKEKEREDSVELVESSSVLTDEVIERVRQRQEERAPRSVGDAETLSSNNWKEHTKEKREKREKGKEKERKKVVQEFKKENTKKKEKKLAAQDRASQPIQALWPTERDQFQEFVREVGLADHPIYRVLWTREIGLALLRIVI